MPFLTKASVLYPSLNLRPSFFTFRQLRILQERSYTSKTLAGPYRPPSLDDLELDPIDQSDPARASPIFVNKPPSFNKDDYIIPSLANKAIETEAASDSRPSRAYNSSPVSYTPWKKPNDKYAASAPLNTNNISEEKARELCNILIEHLPPQMTKRELRALLRELDIRINSIVKIQNGRAFIAVHGEYSLQRILALDANLTLLQRKVLVTQIGPLKSSWRFTMDVPRDVTPEDIKKVLQPLNVDVLHNKKLLEGESLGNKRVAQDGKEFPSKQSCRTSIRNHQKPSYGLRGFSTNVPIELDDDPMLKKGKRARRPNEDTDLISDTLSEDDPCLPIDPSSSVKSPPEHFELPTDAFPTDTNIAISDLPPDWENINNSVIFSSPESNNTPTQEERLILKKALLEALEHGKNRRNESDVTPFSDLDNTQQPLASENTFISVDDLRDDKTFDQLTTEAEQRLRLEKLRDDNLIYQLRVDGFGSQWRYKDLMSLIQEYEIDCSIPTGPQNGLVLMSVVGKHRFERLFKMAGLEMLLKLTLISCSTAVADMLVTLELAHLKQDHRLENLGINIGKILSPTDSNGQTASPLPSKSKNPLQMIVPQYRPDTEKEHYAINPDTLLNIPPTIPYHPPFHFPDDDPHFGRYKESNKRSKSHENKRSCESGSDHSSEYLKNDGYTSDGPYRDK